MRKSVSKLKKKESVYKKGSYKDDHHYLQTSTKFFYNSKQKNPKKTKNTRIFPVKVLQLEPQANDLLLLYWGLMVL